MPTFGSLLIISGEVQSTFVDHQPTDSSTPSTLLPLDMAGPKSGGRTSSVRLVVSSPGNIPSSSAPVRTRTDVILRQQPSGRLGQSVSYTVSKETPDDDDVIPLLLDVPDDEDDDEMNNLADAMEEEFFGQTAQDEPAAEEKQRPVRICMHFYLIKCSHDVFSLALSKIGSHIAKVMSMNSWHTMASAISQNRQFVKAVVLTRLF